MCNASCSMRIVNSENLSTLHWFNELNSSVIAWKLKRILTIESVTPRMAINYAQLAKHD